jgi:peptidyl-prolyl cis-trans isomerase C
MVKEFDDVVFSGEVGATHGPVKTQFGYHLIQITSREN